MTAPKRKRGRPREPDARRAWLSLRIEPSDRERYRAASEATGRAVSDVAREALDAWADEALGVLRTAGRLARGGEERT